MKLFPKLLLAALVIASLLPFTLLKKDDGTTWMSFSDFEMISFTDFKLPDFSPPSLPDLPGVDSITESVGINGETSGPVSIYEWHDSEGNIQFTNEVPPEGVEYRVRRFDTDANVIQSVKLPSGEPATQDEEPQQPEAIEARQAPSAYSPDSVKKLMDDARNIEKLLDQRLKNQQSAIDQ